MPTENLAIFGMLRKKMSYHQTRQGLLSQNVANAETSGYRARDLKALKFQKQFSDLHMRGLDNSITNANHIKGKPILAAGPRFGIKTDTWETTPEGNSVVLEEEMMKVAGNQIDYQAAASLYQKNMGIIRMGLRSPR